MLCQECSKKETCQELCLEAEIYASRDYKRGRESPQVEFVLEYLNTDSVYPYTYQEMVSYYKEAEVNFPFLTDLQNKCLHLFYFEGKTYKQIARAMSGNRSKTKLNQRQVRRQLYLAKRAIREHLLYI